MWCNHPFRQRNKTIKRAVSVQVGDDVEGGLENCLKREGVTGNIGVFIK